MTAILSVLAVIGTALWYYRTAEQLRLPGLPWAVAGVLIYYSGFLLCMYGILRPLLGGRFQTHDFGIGIGMDLSSILFGVGAVAAFRALVLLKKAPPP